MTTDQPHERPVNRTVADAVTAAGLSVFAGLAIAVLCPRAVPYVAGGLVVLYVGTATVDMLRGRTAAPR